MRCCSIETHDVILLKKIVDYCNRIDGNLKRYNYSRAAFEEDCMFLDACCMCVVQIGELVGQLSDQAKKLNPAMPWRAIKDTRNFYVHAYGSIDVDAVWETLRSDIPALREACEKMLHS